MPQESVNISEKEFDALLLAKKLKDTLKEITTKEGSEQMTEVLSYIDPITRQMLLKSLKGLEGQF